MCHLSRPKMRQEETLFFKTRAWGGSTKLLPATIQSLLVSACICIDMGSSRYLGAVTPKHVHVTQSHDCNTQNVFESVNGFVLGSSSLDGMLSWGHWFPS